MVEKNCCGKIAFFEKMELESKLINDPVSQMPPIAASLWHDG